MKKFSLSSFKKLWPGFWINRFLEFDNSNLFLREDQGLQKLYVWLMNVPVTAGFLLLSGLKLTGFFSSSFHQSLENPDSNLAMIYGFIYLITLVSFVWALFRGTSCIKAKQRHDANQMMVKTDSVEKTQTNQVNQFNVSMNTVHNNSNNNNKNIEIENSKALYFSEMGEVEQMLHHEMKIAKNSNQGKDNNFSQSIEKEQE